MDVGGRSPGRRETTQKLTIGLLTARTWRRLTEGLPATRHVDLRSSVLTESWQRLTKCLLAAWNVYGKSLGRRNVDGWSLRMHRNVMEVEGSSSGHTECWQKFIEVLPAARKVDGSWCNVSRPDGMLTKGDGRSPGCTDINRKLKGSLPATWNIDRRSSSRLKLSVNFPCGLQTFYQFPSTLRVAWRLSIIVC